MKVDLAATAICHVYLQKTDKIFFLVTSRRQNCTVIQIQKIVNDCK